MEGNTLHPVSAADHADEQAAFAVGSDNTITATVTNKLPVSASLPSIAVEAATLPPLTNLSWIPPAYISFFTLTSSACTLHSAYRFPRPYNIISWKESVLKGPR